MDKKLPTVSKQRVEALKGFIGEGYRSDYLAKEARLGIEEPYYGAYAAFRVNTALQGLFDQIEKGEVPQHLLYGKVYSLLCSLMAEAFWLGRGDEDFGLQQDAGTLKEMLERMWKMPSEELSGKPDNDRMSENPDNDCEGKG